jgi:hypothetical protein
MHLISVGGLLYHNFSIYVAHYTKNSLLAEKNVKTRYVMHTILWRL